MIKLKVDDEKKWEKNIIIVLGNQRTIEFLGVMIVECGKIKYVGEKIKYIDALMRINYLK